MSVVYARTDLFESWSCSLLKSGRHGFDSHQESFPSTIWSAGLMLLEWWGSEQPDVSCVDDELTRNLKSTPVLEREMIRISESDENRKLRDAWGSIALRVPLRHPTRELQPLGFDPRSKGIRRVGFQ